MAQRTNCPACGAPLDDIGQQAMVQCRFCGASVQVLEEEGATRFQIIDQPAPQKEILSQPVAGEAPSDTMSQGASDPTRWDGIPRGTASSSAGDTLLGWQPVESGAPVGGLSAPMPRRNNTWVYIAVGVVALACILCGCLVLASIFLSRRNFS